MLSNDYLAFAIIAVVIFTVYMAIMHLLSSANRFKNRISNSVDASFMDAGAEEIPPAMAQFSEWWLTLLKVDPNTRKDVALKLSRAGIENPYAVSYFLFFSRVFQPVLVVVGLGWLFTSFKGGGTLDILMNLIVALVIVVIGLRGAKLYVDNARQKRLKVLIDSFPETLDLLLVCIESGLGLDAALNRVCKELREIHPVVVSELDRTRLELTMLNDRTQALQNLGERVELVSFKTLVASLIQTEKFGTSLVDTLRVLSEEQRLARLYEAEQKAARIPVLITIPLIICIMPAFIMIIVGPPIVKVMNQGGIFGGAIIGTKK